MEEVKHLPPNYSYALRDLANFYGINDKMDPVHVPAPVSVMSMTSSDKSFMGRETFTPKTAIALNPIKEANIRKKFGLNKSIDQLKNSRRYRK